MRRIYKPTIRIIRYRGCWLFVDFMDRNKAILDMRGTLYRNSPIKNIYGGKTNVFEDVGYFDNGEYFEKVKT